MGVDTGEGTGGVPVTLEEGLRGVDPSIARVYLEIARKASGIHRHLPFRVGMTQGINPSGELQAELDIYTNDLFANAFLDTGVVGEVASEEMETPRALPSRKEALLSVAMDPLDGSSNIPTNNTLGSIFGIWKGPLPQPGRSLLAAAFVTYGPTLTLTLTQGRRVDQYIEVREGPHKDRFMLAHKGLRFPEKPEVYGIGGDRVDWIPAVERFVAKLERRKMRLRYGGAFIGDFNQVLKRGGIFAYPELKNKPMGKLRILYETAPMSLLTEFAGGASTNGQISILDIEPQKYAETSPFYIGNKALIDELVQDLHTTSVG